jgi:hypothetical protein
MTDVAKRIVWKQAEIFAQWAVRQPRDVADELRAQVHTAKLLVQAGAIVPPEETEHWACDPPHIVEGHVENVEIWEH